MYYYINYNTHVIADYFRARKDFFPILGYGLTIARACGAGLKFTGSVILITMCRNFLSR